jgi:hypothetical protein
LQAITLWFAIAIAGLAVSACTADRRMPSERSPIGQSDAARCHAVFDSVGVEVDAAGTNDAEARQIAGYPFLRADRFLASFADTDMELATFRAWTERLRDLALDGIGVEVGNLASATRKRLDDRAKDLIERPAIEAAGFCAEVLLAEVLRAPNARTALRDAVEVPDHYDDLQRLVGVYPLTALPVALGYDRWRALNLGTFGLKPSSLPTAGKRVAYQRSGGGGALPPAEVRAILDRSRDNPLGIPEPSLEDTAGLIDAYAPVWIVDTIGNDDRVGAIEWDRDDALAVATDRPAVYHRLSWTRFGGDILLQLNYLAWFPARTKQSAFDVLGGALDAVIWRVTLGADGRPMVYDAIHACGCYHLFFPVPPLIAKPGPPPRDIRERAEVAAKAPEIAPGERVTVWLGAISHYIQALSTTSNPDAAIAETTSYDLLRAAQLRSLEMPGGGSRSMYGPDGIVDGTERLERFLLWPMGIASPGAMRQWGTHATAFVGRRHFDDPWLFEDAFEFPHTGRRR